MSKSFQLYTCGEEPAGFKSVSVANGVLTIHTSDGKSHSVTLPAETPEDYVTAASLSGNVVTLTRKRGGTVRLDLTTLVTALNNKQVNTFTRDGNTLKITLQDGSTKTVTLPDDKEGVTAGRLRGSNLELLGKDNTVLSTVALGSLVPAAKADRFLKNVTYNSAGKKFVFTVGENGNTTNDTTIDVPAADLTKSTVGRGLSGDGSAANPLTLKIDQNTLKFNQDGTLSVKSETCAQATNLNTLETRRGTLKREGVTCFGGLFGGTSDDAVIGLPSDWNTTTETTATSTMEESNALSPNRIDMIGWQVASLNGEVIQTIVITLVNKEEAIAFQRTHDGGLNPDTLELNADVARWSKWQRLDNVPQAPATTPSGLDCSAIGKLPKKPWAKGTTILARDAAGACHQLTALDSIFQEIGVGIAANKTHGLTGEKYNVVVTVTNTGEGTNERTNLTITKPALGNYTVSDWRMVKGSAATMTRTDDWNYVISGLPKGGTSKVEFSVTPSAHGTFQFGASVNPNTALDMQQNNNRATVTLSATTPIAPNYTPSTDCPHITATMNGTPLLVTVFDRTDSCERFSVGRTNVVDADSLSGVEIVFDNDVTVVVVAGGDDRDKRERVLLFDNGKHTAQLYKCLPHKFEPHGDMSIGSNIYSMNGRTLRFNNGIRDKAAGIYVRPRGENCKWQCIKLVTVLPVLHRLTLTATGIAAEKGKQYNADKINTAANGYLNSYTYSGGTLEGVYDRVDDYGVNSDDTMTIRIPRNTAKSFSITASVQNYFSNAVSKGNVNVSPNGNRINVTVSDKAMPTDSITFGNVRIIIE